MREPQRNARRGQPTSAAVLQGQTQLSDIVASITLKPRGDATVDPLALVQR
jgi:hypothetical protein